MASVDGYQRGEPGKERLVLGTAQLVSSYGIVNNTSAGETVDERRAHELIDCAMSRGVDSLDTSPLYGQAESTIGSSNWSGKIWTKLDPHRSPRVSVDRSLRALRRDSIDTLFVHDITSFLSLSRQDINSILSLRGPLVRRLGISVYEPREIDHALQLIDFDVVQVPLNVFDDRFEVAFVTGGLPQQCTYVCRSALLQGLLAQPFRGLGSVPRPLSQKLKRWGQICRSLGRAPGEVAIAWALTRSIASAVIVGAENSEQLNQLIAWSRSNLDVDAIEDSLPLSAWPWSDPRSWSK